VLVIIIIIVIIIIMITIIEQILMAQNNWKTLSQVSLVMLQCGC